MNTKGIFTKQTAFLSTVILIGGAAGVFGYDNLRFWATPAQMQEIAGVSIKTAIAQRADFLALERRELRLCEQAGQNCIGVERRIRELEREIETLKIKQRKYGG